MAHKWISEKSSVDRKCDRQQPVLVLKCDDDVFVEIFHLIEFVTAIYGREGPRQKSLVCDVLPSGTAMGTVHLAAAGEKERTHPKYCNGMAYLMTPDLAEEFIGAAEKVSGTIRLKH
jgi:hypothetical protein